MIDRVVDSGKRFGHGQRFGRIGAQGVLCELFEGRRVRWC